jgi:hypothetical protein
LIKITIFDILKRQHTEKILVKQLKPRKILIANGYILQRKDIKSD